jgi:deoxyribonuclease V
MLPPLPDMVAQLQSLVDQVPAGRVTTYGALATALGDVIASRWVAHFLLHDVRSATWPSHRIVRADGNLGLYAHGDANDKATRLLAEGVAVAGGKADLATCSATINRQPQPLVALRELQASVRKQIRLQPLAQSPRWVAGLDVSYIGEHHGVGGYALVDTTAGKLAWSTTVTCDVPFPYISSYLTFRELPVLAQLLSAAKAADRLADVYMIDGAGVLHPRRIGVAAHFGVVADVPTIGVTKTHLAGSFDDRNMRPGEPREIHDCDEPLGFAIAPRASSKKLLYVSAGHRIDRVGACEVVQRLLLGHASPEPIYWADRLSRQATLPAKSAT